MFFSTFYICLLIYLPFIFFLYCICLLLGNKSCFPHSSYYSMSTYLLEGSLLNKEKSKTLTVFTLQTQTPKQSWKSNTFVLLLYQYEQGLPLFFCLAPAASFAHNTPLLRNNILLKGTLAAVAKINMSSFFGFYSSPLRSFPEQGQNWNQLSSSQNHAIIPSTPYMIMK